LALCASAAAAPPDFLTRMGSLPGGGAGALNNPRGIAADSTTGRVYISDLNNARVNEYTAWGLFVKSWGWGVADGSSEAQTCGPTEPEEAPSPILCQAGQPGSAAGQLSLPVGLTVDASGDIYVFEQGNLRVQKFNSAGEFELMFGGGVNASSGADVCAKADLEGGDVCGAGTSGEGPSELDFTVGNVLAFSAAANAIVVGDKARIQIFNLDGSYREEIDFQGPLGAFAGKSVNGLDVDVAGNIYFSLAGVKDVHKISATGEPLAPTFSVVQPLGVAVDHEGNVFAIDDDPTPAIVPEVSVVKFDSAGNKLIPTKMEEEGDEHFPFIPFQGPRLNGIATNICPGSDDPGNLYISHFTGIATVASYVDAYGSPPIGCEDPPLRAPLIVDQYAAGVGSESARVQAQIDPKFWPDTTYYVEYGKAPCSDSGCTSTVPVDPALLTKQSTSKALKSGLVSLTGLESGTTYHYRFVAESGGGGPVYGIDPDGDGPNKATFGLGLEGSFRTLNQPTFQPACPNDAFRKGAGAQLPDCRAYEMVSPLDKEGGDVAPWRGNHGVVPHLFELHQSALSGEQFTYTSTYAFADPQSAPYVSQYLAGRTGVGWSSEAISPARTEPPSTTELTLLNNEFQLFSPDLCAGWLRHNSIAPLTGDAIPGFPNLYRRDNCAEPASYTALTTNEPLDRDPAEYRQLRVHGVSDDGTHEIFVANGRLHNDAPVLPGESEMLLYERVPEGLRFVCYLPDGTPSTEACGAGTVVGLPGGALSSARNAISANGARVFWSLPQDSNNPAQAPGPIYVRIDGTETREVSGSVAPDPAWYWTAADDGSKAIFAFNSGPHKDELYEFDVDAETATLIAKGVLGPMGASEDASRIYFASTEDLDGGGPGSTGARNLYLYDANVGGAGTFTFVTTLANADLIGTTATGVPIDEIPAQRSAGVTPDGLHTVFTSVAPPLSGYDNREATSGEPAQEVYRYDAVAGELACISCNPTGARPTGAPIGGTFPAAARIQGWEALGHAPRVISDDGSRVFFESFEALVPRDTNGTWDVYQWEEPGKGSCDTKDATYSTETGGCVDLISSGESKAKSTFLDADPSGNNIFFSTQSSLVGQDYGLNDVYVARVGGGFPEPQAPPICEGEACQSPAAAPSPPTPSSSSYRQPSQLERKPRPRCPKGKRKVKRAGKVRCVKKRKGARAGKRANRNRRAAR